LLYLYCCMRQLYKIIFIVFAVLFYSLTCRAQEYSYVHYDVQNGIAGANVYAVYQDKQKFLWFGTETGVSRFDGTNFKNYTTNEGLPDNEILEIYGDDEGRVWFVPFKKTICYYYKGKIYNQQNDTLLRKIKLHSNVLVVCEDKYKNTWLLEERGIYLITPEKTVRYFNKINNREFSSPVYMGLTAQKEIIIQWEDKIYAYRNGRFEWLFTIHFPEQYRSFLNVHIAGDYIIWRSGKNAACAQSISSGDMHCFAYPDNGLRFSTPGNGTIAINTSNGTSIYNPVTRKTENTFLQNISVSKVLIDHEGSWWFTTLGEGIYQLLSTEYKNYVPWKEGTGQEIFSITKAGNQLVMGTNFSELLYTADFKNVKKTTLPTAFKEKYNRITALYKTPDNKIICGTDEIIAVMDDKLQLKQYAPSPAVKYIHYHNNDSIYIATSNNLARVSSNNLAAKEIVWNERSTAVSFYKNTLFVGTLNGLYHIPQKKLPVYMGDYDTLFSKRISSMVISADSTLWVGTYDGGLVSLKNGEVVDTITTKEGLTSNICRNLFISDNVLYAGTDKGLSRIDLNKSPYIITPFTVNDGLLSNLINAVYKENDTVYVASQDGITYFDVKKVINTSQCNLEIISVFQSATELPLTDKYLFNHKENNIRVEYVGISFKSTGDIIYSYKLLGLDTAWKTTKETSLNFLSLPPGSYTLQLMATNKFGVKSGVKEIAFQVAAAYYQTPLFYTLALMVTAALTLLLVSMYNRARRRKEKRERDNLKKIADLEQMALRAQMNPHFIFNCLNSIQQFVYDKDIQSANRFIGGFAKLIRQTLDNSTRTNISIADEAGYLTNYLALEKIRFENSFDYSIKVDPAIKTEDYKIPVMLLQPYIENSIRHGIRYKKDGAGMITVEFKLKENELICIIQDNGIGRQKAEELKSKQHIEYQSKGMLLTSERIETINKTLSEKITIDVEDLYDESKKAAGTKIIIHFPQGLVQNS
jgi:ligand-binding sensor domain-containing protein